MADKAKETAAAAAEPACSMHHSGGSKGTCQHCLKHKHRDKDGAAYKRMMTRLKRIEGQVRGIEKMVEDDRYCIDILTQISAATRALETVALGLLDDHMRHCVAQAVQQGGDEAETKLTEAREAIARLVRS